MPRNRLQQSLMVRSHEQMQRPQGDPLPRDRLQRRSTEAAKEMRQEHPSHLDVKLRKGNLKSHVGPMNLMTVIITSPSLREFRIILTQVTYCL